MHRILIASCLLLASVNVQAEGGIGSAIDCAGNVSPYPLPVRPSAVPPVAFELMGAGSQLGAPRGTLAHYSDERQSVDRVLLRLRTEHCRPTVADPGVGYVPQTEHDNTPYRFNANTGFTAAEFDAWMKERGIRIVNGRAVVGGTVQPAAAEPEAIPACTQIAGQPRDETLSC